MAVRIKRLTREEFRDEALLLTAKAADEASKSGNAELAVSISNAGVAIELLFEKELFESDDVIEFIKEE